MYSEIVKIRLIQERTNAGYSQRDLAKHTGISNITIAKIEAGTRKPDIDTVGTLAEFYDISVDWLFGIGKKTKDGNT